MTRGGVTVVDKQRLIADFFELVKIDSETKYEATIASFLKEKFTALGLEVREDKAKQLTEHEANNLICTLRGTAPDAETIFFASHMDTVTPAQNVKPQLADDGYIVSDGTTILGADDKAGIAVMFEVIRVLKEQQIPHGDLQFIITVGEESGLAGAKVIDRSLILATSGYVLDSDGAVGNMTVQAPYQTRINAIIRGKTAHAGIAPEKGVSAISIAAKAIAKMRLGRIDEETTANISYFKGGQQAETNIVCDYAEIEGEARSLDKAKLTAVTNNVRQAFEKTALEFGGSVEVQLTEMYPGYRLSEADDVVQVAQRAARRLDLPSEMMQSGGGSDANVFNNIGIPTANLSVGYEYIHTTKERIHEEQLVQLTNLVVEIITETTV